MDFFVQKEVKDLGVKILGAVIEGTDNHGTSEKYLKWRSESVNALLEKYSEYDVKEDPVLQAFYILHDRVHVPRRKIIPASENLIRTLIKKGSLHEISKVADIYNIISMESRLALGAHDIDLVSGNITLKITDGSERFIPLGASEPVLRPAGEYSYVDDSGDVLCWLEVKQSEKDKVTEDTERIFYIIQGNEETPDELLTETAQRIIDTTVRFCGGTGRILIPSEN